MSKCVWQHKDDLYECIYCGFRVPGPDYVKECRGGNRPAPSPDAVPPKPPGMMTRAQNLLRAGVNHAIQGFKHCSEDEKLKRFTTCKHNKCGLFVSNPNNPDQGVCSHESCGCFIRARGEFMDKLSWAESKCPVGLWGPVKPKSP